MIDRRTLGFLGHFLRAYPLRSGVMIVLLALAGFAEGVGVVALLPLLELVAGGEEGAGSAASRLVEGAVRSTGLEPTLGTLLAVIVLVMSAKAGFLWLAMREVGYTVAQVTTDLRMNLLRTLLGARWRYFTSQATGRFANAVSAEAHRAASAYREGCVVLAGLLQILAYAAVAVLISPVVAALALVAGASFIFLLRRFVRASRDAGQEQTDLMRSLIERLTDTVRGMKPIKAMGREEHVRPLLESETQGLNDALRRQVMAAETLRLFQEPMLVVLLAGGLFVALTGGGLPFTSVIVMAFIFYRLMSHVNTLQTRFQTLVVGESAYWSLQEQVELAEAEREPARGTRPPPPLEDGIELDSVWFSYETEPVLRGLSLRIPARKFVTLFGASGAGKTTIADLVLGLYEPERGSITIDGVPLPEIDMGAWRRSVGYVPQEMLLFHDTVLRNVTLGDPAISREDAEAALRDAGAWEFVAARGEGIDTVIGEQGVRFSGGQRQRIAIARALVHRPRLLVLDEVTTALDPSTEAAICETLRELSDRVTIVAISHQPALRNAADLVYRLSEGEVVRVEEREAAVETA